MIFLSSINAIKVHFDCFSSTFFEEDYYFHLGVPILEKELAGLESILSPSTTLRTGFTEGLQSFLKRKACPNELIRSGGDLRGIYPEPAEGIPNVTGSPKF